MSNTAKQVGLVFSGLVAGILLALSFLAVASREAEYPLPLDEMSAFTRVYGAIKESYVEPVEDKKLLTEAINGMLSGLDPHSAYLDAEAYKELRASTDGEFEGLGIEVGMEEGFVKVVSPIEDTPAFKAGLKPGDLIIKLDDTPVKGMSLADAVKRMRGKPKTSIQLTVMRKGETKPLVFNIVRDVIRTQSVKSKMFEPGYGYVRVTQFQKHTGEDLVKHLNTLYKSGPLKGLVLDLRNDPGGILDGAVGVSAAFLPPKVPVVSTDGRVPNAKRKFIAAPEDYLREGGPDYLKNLPGQVKNVPLVVLINGGSASASEIVAGALQDYKRATVLGTQSFGKGSVQSIIPLSKTTAIKLTTALYHTPQGRVIQAKGITPDIAVEEPGAPTRMLREADLLKHLSGAEKEDIEKARAAIEASAAEKDQDTPPKEATPAKPVEFGSEEDFQLKQAINHLKGLPVLAKLEKPTATTASASPETTEKPKKN